jgi:hypothetical protein
MLAFLYTKVYCKKSWPWLESDWASGRNNSNSLLNRYFLPAPKKSRVKNKHLVLLFLATLAVGLLARRFPWRNVLDFRAELVRLDTAQVIQLSLQIPGQAELLLERSDAGWVAAQADRNAPVPPLAVDSMLAALRSIRSIRIAHSQRPDTLGLAAHQALRVVATQRDGHRETLFLGRETFENSELSTYVQLAEHQGIYLAANHLRRIFWKNLRDFRPRLVTDFGPATVRAFLIFGEMRDSVFATKNDSTGQWSLRGQPLEMADDSVKIWLRSLSRLNGLPFADLFDESLAEETLVAHIALECAGQAEPLTFKIFHLKPPNIPEVLPAPAPDRQQFAPYVLHSSQNPNNYFALPDSLLAKRLARGPGFLQYFE